jgi:hypothetical protein
MLTSFHAVVVEEGKVQLPESVRLRPGTEVVVVVMLPDNAADRARAFADYAELVDQYPAEVDPATISDEELVELVHQVRAEQSQ